MADDSRLLRLGGAWGGLCDRFFTLQTALFGSGTDFTTVALKTAVEQLVWTALFCVPLGTVFFFWLSRDFSWRRSRAEWPRRFVRDKGLGPVRVEPVTRLEMDAFAHGAEIAKAVIAFLGGRPFPQGMVLGSAWKRGKTF